MSYRQRFAERLRAREALAGVFVKSRDPAVIEILGHAGFDFAILDAEHVAFGRSDIAAMMMASRAANLATLVRIPGPDGHWIATCLDAGAAGIMVPQVQDAKMAADLVMAMRHGFDGEGGSMGFSPSTPGAEYGTRGIAGHLAQHPRETVLICQIEDPGAVENAAAIASVDGVDGLLVGPVDLAVSIGQTDPNSPDVQHLCEATLSHAPATGAATGLFLSDPAAVSRWRKSGASLFVLGTDQGYLLQGGRAVTGSFRSET